MSRAAGVLLLVTLLAGCAPLSKKDCRQGDWGTIGHRDGVHGETAGLLDVHRKVCGSYGVTPDATAYRKGYADGLAQYCSAAGGYREGRAATTYRDVCSKAQEAVFLTPYGQGRDVAGQLAQLRDLQRYIAQLQSTVTVNNSGRIDTTQTQLAEAQVRRDRLRGEIERADLRYSRKYGVPPLGLELERY